MLMYSRQGGDVLMLFTIHLGPIRREAVAACKLHPVWQRCVIGACNVLNGVMLMHAFIPCHNLINHSLQHAHGFVHDNYQLPYCQQALMGRCSS